MAYPLQLPHEPSRAASGPVGRGEPDVTVDWLSIEEDLDIVRHTKANLLLIGPDWLVTELARRIIADVVNSIIDVTGERRPPHPSRLPRRDAVLLRDIHKLDADGQAALFEGLESMNGQPQIVCTASPSLPALVASGRFDARLYYRLNTVCIDVSSRPRG